MAEPEHSFEDARDKFRALLADPRLSRDNERCGVR